MHFACNLIFQQRNFLENFIEIVYAFSPLTVNAHFLHKNSISINKVKVELIIFYFCQKLGRRLVLKTKKLCKICVK